MRNHLTRTIAWLCIVAHFNLIMPTFHEARAMDFEEEGVHRTHVTSKFSQSDPDLQPHSYMHGLWNGITSLGSALLDSDIPGFALGVITEDPLSYAAYSAGKLLIDYLKEDPESVTKVVKKTVDVVKDASQVVVSTIPYVSPLLLPVTHAIDINGGKDLNMSYDPQYCSGIVYFTDKTGPYPIDFDPNSTIQTNITHGCYDPNKPDSLVGCKAWKAQYDTLRTQLIQFLAFNPGSMNASMYNLTRQGDPFSTTRISIISTGETIRKFLSNLQIWYFDCNTRLTNFNYFTMDNESLINASRTYYSPNPTPAPTNAPVDPIPIVMGTLGGCFLVPIVGGITYAIVKCRKSADYITVNVGSEDQQPTPQGENYQS